MISDKEITLDLIDLIEEMHLREVFYETLLSTLVADYDWKGTLAEALANPSHRRRVHEKFQPLRDCVLDAPDLTTVVRRMIEGLDDKLGQSSP